MATPPTASPLATPAAQALNAIRTAPTLKLGLAQLSDERRAQLELNPAMDLQAVVITLTSKVGYGPLDGAYRRLTGRALLQDFAPQLSALDASRDRMRMNGAQQAGVIDAMISQHDRNSWGVGHQVLDRFGRTDNLLPNLLMGTTRQLGRPVVNLPGPVGAALGHVRSIAGGAANVEVDRYDVLDDPKALQALVHEVQGARARGQLPQLLTAFQQRTGQSLYTRLGEVVRDANQRQRLLALLPPPISEKQLTFDAFLENVAIGMVYDNAPAKAVEHESYEDPRRGGEFGQLLDAFGYHISDVIAGKWGLELRILTPIPGKARTRDVIVAWRGTEGIAANLKTNRAGTIDTKVGDFAPGSIGYYQIMQNKEIVDHQLARAREHGPLLMVGHSLGGGLAQLAATLYPQYTRTVVTFQGANIDQKDIDRLVAYNKANPALAISARHYRADGDIVPTAGDAAVPGQIHYFDPQWRAKGTSQTFGSTASQRFSSGHNIPLLNTYLQGLNTKNPAMNLIKQTGIQDENGQPRLPTGQVRPGSAQLDARVVYGGGYTTARDPRMVIEGGRDNLLRLQKVATRLDFRMAGFSDLLTDELPANTLLDHLTTLAGRSASYEGFVTQALKLMGLQDRTYGPITLKVSEKDKAMAKAMAMKLPATVPVQTEVVRSFVEPRELSTHSFRRLKTIWASVKS
ncbi:lipase family protein [Deinococcus navajonensis]|uniref:Lipase (Class 3) n=1 Tax=Deinococcus navajonensis TaxID=309884 RepID=A0ABV8XRL8_9DEIO